MSNRLLVRCLLQSPHHQRNLLLVRLVQNLVRCLHHQPDLQLNCRLLTSLPTTLPRSSVTQRFVRIAHWLAVIRIFEICVRPRPFRFESASTAKAIVSMSRIRSSNLQYDFSIDPESFIDRMEIDCHRDRDAIARVSCDDSGRASRYRCCSVMHFDK